MISSLLITCVFTSSQMSTRPASPPPSARAAPAKPAPAPAQTAPVPAAAAPSAVASPMAAGG